MLECLGGPFLNRVQACSPDENFRKGLSFCDILCVFTIWLHTRPIPLCECVLMTSRLNRLPKSSVEPKRRLIFWLENDFAYIHCFCSTGMSCSRSRCQTPPLSLPFSQHPLCREALCQQPAPLLSLSLTTTVRSSRWWAIKPDNKRLPSIPVCLLLLSLAAGAPLMPP